MPIIDSKQFARELKKARDFLPLYLFVGEEETLISDALKNFQTAFFARYGNDNPDFNFENLHGGKDDSGKILDSCGTLPFAAEKKLVILHRLEKCPEETRKSLGEYCQNPNPSACLVILWNTRPNQSAMDSEIAQAASQTGVTLKFWKPYESDRPQWIRDEAAKSGRKITPEASLFLSLEGGESLGELKSEIEKLCLYTEENGEIGVDDVRESMSFRRNSSVWDFIDTLEAGKIKKAGQIFERLMDQGEEPVKMLNLIARSVRKTASSPLYGGKTGSNKLAQMFNELKKADLMLKTGHDVESAVFERILILFGRVFSK